MNHPTLNDVVSCLSGYDPDALPVTQAQQIIRTFVMPLQAVEKVAIRSALDRVLASDIVSTINVPAHDNSAMDGYAFSGASLDPDEPNCLRIVGTTYAGRAHEGPVAAGECVRIMTGGVMPAGCDTVVPQEFTSQSDTQSVMLPPGVVQPGDNRRLAGEDLAAGQPALVKGKILRPA
ncbi:MAG: molybdopterin molybdenumtransferase MoeA, partial [Noviherbaspirillum sp.]